MPGAHDCYKYLFIFRPQEWAGSLNFLHKWDIIFTNASLSFLCYHLTLRVLEVLGLPAKCLFRSGCMCPHIRWQAPKCLRTLLFSSKMFKHIMNIFPFNSKFFLQGNNYICLKTIMLSNMSTGPCLILGITSFLLGSHISSIQLKS